MANHNFSLVDPQQVKADSSDLDNILDQITIIFYTLTVVFGILGNGSVIWVAGFCLAPSVTNVWLVNLAVADVIFCLTRVLSLIKYLFFDYWPFGLFMCKFNGYFKYANMFCSVFLLSIISLDRAMCVWLPVWTKQRRTIPAARLVSVGVWVLAGALSSPYFIFRHVIPGKKNNLTKCSMEPENNEASTKLALYALRFVFGFLIPFLIILSCYIMAAVGIRRTRLTNRTKPLKILVSLVLAFFLCWTPYHCFLLAKMVIGKSKVVKVGLTVGKGLAYFNSCVNPLLYFCMGLDRRKRLKLSLTTVYRRALAEDGEDPTKTSQRGERSSSIIPVTMKTEPSVTII